MNEISTIQSHVMASFVKLLEGDKDVPPELAEELRVQLSALKLPKSDALVALFEKHAEGTPSDSTR